MSNMFEDLRREAYGDDFSNPTYNGVPILASKEERDAFSKDTQPDTWHKSRAYTNKLFRRQ